MAQMKLKDPHICRVFFSSPFNGLEEEREELTKIYWPQLQSLCASQGIQFVPVDMRWGITTELSDSAQTINICLRELDRSDVFVGFFGQRYGWHGAEDDTLQKNMHTAEVNYPWLAHFQDRSVTELEFLHGHLNNPGQIPAFFCFRDKAYDDKYRIEGEKSGNKRAIYKYSSESETATLRMDDLKKRVKETENQGAQLMFEAVQQWMNENLTKDTSAKSRRCQLLAHHDAFADTLTSVYCGKNSYFPHLTTFTEDAEAVKMLITGPPGCGKSALTANWICEQKNKKPQDISVYYYVGCTRESCDVKVTLRGVISNLWYQLGGDLTDVSPQSEATDNRYLSNLEEKNVLSLVREWEHLMKLAEKRGKKGLVILDGIHRIPTDSKTGKAMYWVPSTLSSSIKLVVMTQSTDSENIAALNTMGFNLHEMSALSLQERQAVCKETLMLRGKELSPGQMDIVINSENSNNLLFLKVVLEELVNFGRFRELNQKIGSLVKCESVHELFVKFLERLENDYNSNDYEGNLVKKCLYLDISPTHQTGRVTAKALIQVMCALSVSRDGLKESDICSMLDIPSSLWSPIYFALERHLLNRDGLLSFSQEELKKAVHQTYMKNTDNRKAEMHIQIKYYVKELNRIMATGSAESIPENVYTESVWLSQQAEDKTQLLQLLTTPWVFAKLFSISKYELLEYWQYLGATGEDIVKHCFDYIDRDMANRYVNCLERYTPGHAAEKLIDYLSPIATFLRFAHYHDAEVNVLLRLKNILECNGNFEDQQQNLDVILYDLACLYVEKMDYEKSREIHEPNCKRFKQRIDECETPKSEDISLLSNTCHGLALVYNGLKMHDQAEKYFLEAIDLYEKHGSVEDKKERINTSKSALANTHYEQGKFEQAIAEYEAIVEEQKEIFFGKFGPEFSHTLTNLGICYRKMQMFDKAEDAYKTALDIKLRAYGDSHFDIAIAYTNLANLEADVKNFDKSLEYNLLALKVYEATGMSDTLNACFILDNIARTYLLQGNAADGEPYFMRAYNWLKDQDLLHYGLASVYISYLRHLFMQGQVDKAEPIVKTLLPMEHYRDPLLYEMMAHIDFVVKPNERDSERPEIFSLDAGIKLFPKHEGLMAKKIEMIVIPERNLEQLTEVMEHFYLSSEIDDDNTVMQLARGCQQVGWPEGAVAIYEYWLINHSDHVVSLASLAGLHKEAGRVEAALACLQRAVMAAPDHWQLQLELSKQSMLAANSTLAHNTLDRMEKKWSDNDEIMQHVKDHKKNLETLDEYLNSQKQTDDTGTNTQDESPKAQ